VLFTFEEVLISADIYIICKALMVSGNYSSQQAVLMSLARCTDVTGQVC